MSITNSKTWCPTCCDECIDHPYMCTICGDTLTTNNRNDVTTNNTNTVNFRDSLTTIMATAAAATAGATTTTATATQQQQQQQQQQLQRLQQLLNNNTNNEEEWQRVPNDVMDPNTTTTSRPTAQWYIDQMPIITLHDCSALLHEAIIDCYTVTNTKKQQFSAMISEFPPFPPFTIQGTLHRSPLLHGSKTIHSSVPTTTTTATTTTTTTETTTNCIYYMERGGNVTFVEKAKYAAALGARAVICANHGSVWPYTMKDSLQQSSSSRCIPIVMVKQSDGKQLKSMLRNKDVRVQIQACTKNQQNKETCIICCDNYQPNDVIVRIPHCNHYFHKQCALQWLKTHSTCPFCRRDLPNTTTNNTTTSTNTTVVGEPIAPMQDGLFG